MNQIAPKEFLKRRAVSLYRSGIKPPEIARMLSINVTTAHCWVSKAYGERRLIQKALSRAEKMAALRWAEAAVPTLAFVPHITPSNGKYTMRAP